MKTSLLLMVTFISISSVVAQNLSVNELTTENKSNPLGVSPGLVRMSWKLKTDGQNVTQQAYSIQVASHPDFKKILWHSGKIAESQSIYVPYKGPQLKSGVRYYWRVKVWDNKKRESGWSSPGFFETGLITDDWTAVWIEPNQDTSRNIPALMVRKEFEVAKPIMSARAYITSHGLYDLTVNGRKPDDQVLTPGWTAYDKRIQYQTYDITSIIKQGKNAIGVMLGDGWYRGKIGWVNNSGVWGKTLGLLCQIKLVHKDGTESLIISDKSWKSTSTGPIVMNSIYDGETYDAQKEMKGWDQPGFDVGSWYNVNEAQHPLDNLIVSETVPVRRIQEIAVKKIFKTPSGTLVGDLGQNMVGWIRLKVKGPAGTKVVIRHAEVLDKEGEFYTENLRSAQATMTYILKGDPNGEVYEPRFTFFGFRYIAVEGFPGEPKPENFTGVVVHSDMKPTGTFECSNALVNQLQHNIQWGQRGNFVDVPTDCPQRDERLGWTGDAQAFCRTAAFNMDVAAFFTKWLKDVAADQDAEGRVPFVIPNALKPESTTSAGWGDVATIAPWTMYRVYGDKAFLENQYVSMKAYVDYIEKKSAGTYIWKDGSVFGDWLYYKPRVEEHTVPDGHTNKDMIATMFFAYSSKLVAKAAKDLGKDSDAKYYEDLFNKIKETFVHEYVTPTGRIASDSQTAYVLALMFNLMPENQKTKATQFLVDDIQSRGNHLSTGFLGTPYLCHVLSANDQTKVAYDLLLQESFPSWLFPVKMGATTIWERWDGQRPDSTFQDKGMNSFNHYAYGAIGDWLYQVVAGIDIMEPGYKHILIYPHPDERLSYAKATYNSVYGEIKSGWELKDGNISVNMIIPPNTTAFVRLPNAQIANVKYNGGPVNGFGNARQDDGSVIIEVGSGSYTFNYPFNKKGM